MPESGSAVASTPAASRKRRRLSWIWLVPLIAAVGGLALVVRVWMEAGPTATISFQTAEGLEAGKTQVRYKEVVVGVVERVALNSDRSGIVATVRINKDAGSLLQEGTMFWVVRPRLTLSGVSGLSTLFSGAYIGVDPSDQFRQETETRATKYSFVGLETPPEVQQDRAGKRFTLKAHDLGSLDIGSPVYFRRIAVGEVVAYHLDSSGEGVNVQVFIDAPNDDFVNSATRFWNASGVDFSVDARGLQVRSQSLLSVIVGGVAFDTVEQHAHVAAKADAEFTIFSSEGAARAQPDGTPLHIRMRFDQSVRGLVVGAPIDAYGASIGQVDSIRLEFDPAIKQFYALVGATVYPERLGAQTVEEIKEYSGSTLQHPSGKLLAALIQQGLRAQLRIGNLLTGQLYVALAVFPDAKPVTFKMEEDPFIPTVPNNLDQLQQQINSILTKLDRVPFEGLGADLGQLLRATSSLMKRLDTRLAPEAQAMLRQASKSLAAVGGVLNPDAGLPVNANAVLQELSRAARSLRELSDYLQAHPESLLRGRAPDAQYQRQPAR
ncbi:MULTISPECIES: PqiB family protein [Achromobacter]|uniref:MlaD family protein n=1 Tax=Achromobacter aegrifaciens TaxID=1287736 RepID=A0AAD2KKS9_ACHAE|nr:MULTISPECIES: MlaD family protein [Achromobacter]MBD9380954.1 MCE family protein [Achromobacter sp. ACM02]MBD9429702.1 MCE family protein [Achromobacter sp. ACM03]MBD9475947.1 MCE family protein [Achromobacter sp. ACM01]MDQ1762598.1 MlaD family protein [Achromobacter aegrifaciens]MDR7948605.1 MlaD family protein [Achromobacter aegrifaciens]